MQLTASGDARMTGTGLSVSSTRSATLPAVPAQALAQLAAGDKLAFAPGASGEVLTLEIHRNRGSVDTRPGRQSPRAPDRIQ